MTPSEFDHWLKDPNRRPLIMGVLNVTPDSFSDGGDFSDPTAAIAQINQMVEDGADVIDIGAESTRPGSQRVDEREQIRRLESILRIIGLGRGRPGSPVFSIDTTRAAVAESALNHGVTIINDISAGRDDSRMFELAAKRSAPIVLMHMQGEPATMQVSPQYEDVVREVRESLVDRAKHAIAAGMSPHRILIDPGLGFGKTFDHNIELMKGLRTFADLPYPLVLGPSRKGFLGKIIDEPDAKKRTYATAAAVCWAITNHTAIVRVHDVKEMAQVVRTFSRFRS